VLYQAELRSVTRTILAGTGRNAMKFAGGGAGGGQILLDAPAPRG
jgi:hypothetical protein